MLLNRNISIGYFVNTIKYDIIAIAIYAIVIGFLDNYSILSAISVPLGLTSIVGTSVALLLAFRTSQSYERWWEARTIWGAIVNDSRTLIRQVQSFYVADDAKDTIKEFAYRQIYWCQALTHALRKTEPSRECKQYIEQHRIKDKTSQTPFCQSIPNRYEMRFWKKGSMNSSKYSLTLQSLTFVTPWAVVKELRIQYFQNHTAHLFIS